MSGTRRNAKSDDIHDNQENRTNYVYTNEAFERREVRVVSNEDIQIQTAVSEYVHNGKVDDGKITETKPSKGPLPILFPSTAAGIQERKKSGNLKEKPHVRVDYNTYATKIPELFNLWTSDVEPDVIFSVVSDSESPTTKGNEVIEAMSNGTVQNICRSIVTAVSLTNAWIITGGLNKGIDHFIGNEVRQRLANRDRIPASVLGITNWERFSDTEKDLMKDETGSISNPGELSLNQHHTHFLLVDSSTQLNSGSDGNLRQMCEFALRKRKTNVTATGLNRPLIYIVIGGGVNAFGFVERALANRIPVIIATGTGGAADIICNTVPSKEGATLDYLPEILQKPFHQLEQLLIEDCDPGGADAVSQLIANIKANTKLQPFFDIVELLDKSRLSEEAEEKFIKDIATLKSKTTSDLLSSIRLLLRPIISRNRSDTNVESDTTNRLRSVFEQMLTVHGIPQTYAKKVVDKLELLVLNETLAKVKLVDSNMKAIGRHDQKDLLIKFDIEEQNKTITNVIIEALKKLKCTKPGDVFMLAVDWDDEAFFKQLLVEKWKWQEHESVFMELLKKDKNKYAKQIIEHNSNSKWLTKPQETLKDEYKKIPSCERLLNKIKDPDSKSGNRIMGKVLFVWCIWKQMPDTAMLFWKRGQDCLAMVLLGYQESRRQKRALVNKKGHEQAKQQTKVFAKQSLDFVNKCYEDNTKRTHDLLLGKVKDLDDRTPLQIAVDADFMKFISEGPIQDLLNKIWIKDLEDYDHYYYVPMILSEACPLIAPKLFDIPDDDYDNKQPPDMSRPVSKYFSKVRSFIDIPLVKFSYAFISFLAYLTLFSIVLLTDFRHTIRGAEIALVIWTFILITEEVIQAVVDIREYRGNKWNYLDVGALTLFMIGFLLRMISHGDRTICPDCLYHARIVLAFSLMILFFRTLQFLSVYESLGPKIFMIYQLVADLVSFLVILAVFISAYGVVSNVILYPNQPLDGNLLHDVFNDAWWSVLTQFNMDALGSACKEDASRNITVEYCSSTSYDDIDYQGCKENQCPANRWIVPILLAVYALITCVMLMNVLIAIFNSTFEAINDEQMEVSRMQRYRLIREFSSRSMIPPPLCVFTYPYFIYQELRRRHKAGFLRRSPKAIENSRADVESKDFPLSDNDYNDIDGDEDDKHKKKSTSPTNAFEKDLISAVKDWEHQVVAEYYKESNDKKGWYVARLESETEKTDKFDGIPFMQIRYPSD